MVWCTVRCVLSGVPHVVWLTMWCMWWYAVVSYDVGTLCAVWSFVCCAVCSVQCGDMLYSRMMSVCCVLRAEWIVVWCVMCDDMPFSRMVLVSCAYSV